MQELLRFLHRRERILNEEKKVSGSASHEKRRHSSSLVPYSYYISRIPDYFPFVPLHWHLEWELNYVTEGEGVMKTGDTVLPVSAGDILLIRPEELHAIEAKGRLCYDTVVFRTEMLGSNEDRCYKEMIYPLCKVGAKILPIHMENSFYRELKECTETVISCAKENQAQTDLLMKGELLRLLWYAEQSGAVIYQQKTDSLKEIRMALDYMEEHYEESITIEVLAGEAHLSESYFMQKFREASGMGAIEYLNRLRIQKTCEKILDGMSVADAAYQCGFKNLSNFNRQFKRITGCTPKQYKHTN